jgi:hypothetical protein
MLYTTIYICISKKKKEQGLVLLIEGAVEWGGIEVL